MTLREEFENEIKTNKGGISVLFETSNKYYIEWLECKVKNLSSNTVLADSTPSQEFIYELLKRNYDNGKTNKRT